MANPAKIVTLESVCKAADKLQSRGIQPSNRKILNEIGGGSMTSIAEFLRQWKVSRGHEIRVFDGVSKEVDDDLVTKIWLNKRLKLIESEITEIRKRLNLDFLSNETDSE